MLGFGSECVVVVEPMTHQPIIRIQIEAFDRYLAGISSPSECALVEEWIANNPERSELIMQARQLDDLYSLAIAGSGKHSSALAWKRFLEKQGADSPSTQALSNLADIHRKASDSQPFITSGHSKPPHALPKVWYRSMSRRVVAGIAIAAVAAFAVFNSQLVGPSNGTSITGATQNFTVYETRAGERTTVILRDGSQVTLNVASRLEVPSDFDGKTRTVRLTGQAAFEVVESSGQPFIVEASGTRSIVLGTLFSVRAYTSNVNVAVQSGKISFAPCNDRDTYQTCNIGSERVVLSANEVGRLTPLGELTVRHVAISDEFSFMDGKLSLHDVSLREAINDLQRWYDVDIILADPSLGDLVFDGAFPAGSVDNLVQALEVVLQVRAERKDRTITVYSRTKGS